MLLIKDTKAGNVTRNNNRKGSFAEAVLVVCLFSIGIFHEYLSCIASAVMLTWLVIRIARRGYLHFFTNITSLSVLAVTLSYLISSVWATDSGMALIGFMKYLPVLLFLIVLQNCDDTDRMIEHLPIIGTAMTVISVLCTHIPRMCNYFSVAGRLAGPFQYPNTFAIFLLIAELISIAKEKYRIHDIAVIVTLLFGILRSGSRTVFLLTVIFNLILIIKEKRSRARICMLILTVLSVAAVAVYTAVSGGADSFGRLLSLSVADSSFVGRLLYFRDAIPVILKHPFGLGYMGYYYMQQSVQTGVYSVSSLHNCFLQFMADIGLVPSLMFIYAAAKSIFTRGGFDRRMILCVLSLHCCFDFDLQFVAMFMLLLLFTDFGSGRKHNFKCRCAAYISNGALAVLCVYFGIALGLSRFGLHSAAIKLYPLNTQSEVRLMTDEEDIEKSARYTDDIIRRNRYVTVAYSAKAREAFASGDFSRVIEYKHLVFSYSTFAYDEYEEYCYMLMTGIRLYNGSGDTYSAGICLDELAAAVDSVHTMSERLSTLGRMIKDQPKTVLPDDIEIFVNSD